MPISYESCMEYSGIDGIGSGSSADEFSCFNANRNSWLYKLSTERV